MGASARGPYPIPITPRTPSNCVGESLYWRTWGGAPGGSGDSAVGSENDDARESGVERDRCRRLLKRSCSIRTVCSFRNRCLVHSSYSYSSAVSPSPSVYLPEGWLF